MSSFNRSNLAQKIADMKQGDHACLIYEDRDQQRSAVVPFIKAGLEQGESCMYLASEHSLEEIRQVFNANGIAVDREVKRGALLLTATHLEDSRFDPKALVDDLGARVVRARESGFRGFRATGEMTWILGSNIQGRDLLCYESLLDRNFPNQLIGLCQYNRPRFKPDVIRDLLRTHSVVVVGDAVCRNLYCESEQFKDGDAPDDMGVGWILDNLLKFHAMEDHLRHMIQVRDDFVSIASHELRTPLTALRLQNDIKIRELKKSGMLDPKQVHEFIEQTSHLLGQFQNTIETILDAALVSNKGLTLSLEPMDLVELTKRCMLQMRSTFGGQEIDLISSGDIVGIWDRERVSQAIRNLLSNAMKYGQSKPIRVSVTQDDEWARVTVEDDGIGIAAADQERIFQLYERAISHRSISGLGIGLFLSNQIAHAHGGKIELASELGLGARFTLALPTSMSQYVGERSQTHEHKMSSLLERG